MFCLFQDLQTWRPPPHGPTRGSGEPPEGRTPKNPRREKKILSPPSKDRREGLRILLKTSVHGGGGTLLYEDQNNETLANKQTNWETKIIL